MTGNELGIVIRDSKVVVSSRDVARVFGKEHFLVLRSIRDLGCSKEFNQCNFVSVEYRDAKGEMRPEVLLTRDGFTLLAMGYTGSKAMEFGRRDGTKEGMRLPQYVSDFLWGNAGLAQDSTEGPDK